MAKHQTVENLKQNKEKLLNSEIFNEAMIIGFDCNQIQR